MSTITPATDAASTDVTVLDTIDRQERDFREYMRDDRPRVVEGSPLWFLEHRAYNAANISANLDELAGPGPDWAVDKTFYSRQVWTEFLSEPLTLILGHHPGVRNGATLKRAHAKLQIVQGCNKAEPHIRIGRYAQTDDQVLTEVDGSRYRFRLDEASELAHLLLLLVDVARGSDEQHGGDAA